MTVASLSEAELREILAEICGDDLNGGFIRDLCFTVWHVCHYPKHEDGNADWGEDTLPTVQAGVKKARTMLARAMAEVDRRARAEERERCATTVRSFIPIVERKMCGSMECEGGYCDVEDIASAIRSLKDETGGAS